MPEGTGKLQATLFRGPKGLITYYEFRIANFQMLDVLNNQISDWRPSTLINSQFVIRNSKFEMGGVGAIGGS